MDTTPVRSPAERAADRRPLPPTAAGEERLTDALDTCRFDTISELLSLASKYSAGAAIAAEDGDHTTLAIRARQTVAATREALLVMGTLGKPEATP